MPRRDVKSTSLSSLSSDDLTSKVADLTSKSQLLIPDSKEYKKVIEEIAKYKNALDLKAEKEKKEREKKAEKEMLQLRLEHAQEEGNLKEQLAIKTEEKLKKLRENTAGEIVDAMAAASKLLTSQLDKSVDLYLSQIQAMNAHLSGANSSFASMTNSLQSALSATGLVRQESVFKNLTDYVKSGIVYNVEQRAFLRTIADDISLVFDGWTSSMNQLIRIQRQDSTANRLALEYSLQGFLNTNYQTSEYIKDSFANVSNALITSQSTMTAQNAMAYEATIQTWLGSLYSAGANQSTISELAKAIDQLGSGDISGIGSGISNLVLMGAARAGLDYGSILNQGLNAGSTDRLLAGITSYLAEQSGRESNVVRSQIGKLFGVGITDLIAASNVRPATGAVSTDINSTLFSDYYGFTSGASRFMNMLDNMMFTWGTNIAANPTQLATYKITEMISANLGKALEGSTLKMFGGSVDIGKLIQAAPLLAIIPALFGKNGTIPEVFRSFRNGANNMAGLFNSLGSAVEGTTVKISEAGMSGSAYIGSGSSSDILNNSLSSLNSTLSETSVITQEGPTLEDNVTTITSDVAVIVELLQDHLVAIDNQLTLMGGASTTVYTYAHNGGVSF